MQNTVVLSLGSNVKPVHHLRRAVEELNKRFKICRISSLFESLPVGFLDQPNFLNMAVVISTQSSFESVKYNHIVQIEKILNRVRTDNINGPRTIDIDISFFNSEIREIEDRTFPERDTFTQAHVVEPIAQIVSDFIHPILQISMGEIKKNLVGVRPWPYYSFIWN